MPPPPGGDQFKGQRVRVISIVTFAVAALFVCLRIIGRTLNVHQIGWDDLTIVLALVNIALVPDIDNKAIHLNFLCSY